MKLYLYDHCPFCVRAEMVAHYKQVEHEKRYLLNDDEQSCFDLIGAKMVPILQFDDGTSMGESLDIAHKFDELGSAQRPIRAGTDIQAILDIMNSANFAINCLLFPRNIALGLPEFETLSAREYFRHKKELMIQMPFSQAQEETPQHKAAVEKMLAELPPLPSPEQHDGQLGWDDVLLYPTLRNLTMVRGLVFPEQVRRYIDAVSRITAIRTYDDRAI